ncbi:unnamed protein product [Blepharisma stoltei]|uniref:Uncharacterized protein n=1 Tax=Blepharisma stoltei TaxID=1481888 RepID=A0AAU9J036_9CILI|nr:unnamed protein product [Blepharisma stoltei]
MSLKTFSLIGLEVIPYDIGNSYTCPVRAGYLRGKTLQLRESHLPTLYSHTLTGLLIIISYSFNAYMNTNSPSVCKRLFCMSKTNYF